jgi:hypothetical protein
MQTKFTTSIPVLFIEDFATPYGAHPEIGRCGKSNLHWSGGN